MNPPNPPNPSLIFTVPSFYTNFVSFTYLNGVFRITFFEQYIEPKKDSPGEIVETLSPRVSVTMVPHIAADFLKAFGELYNQVAKSVTTAAATVMPEGDGTGRPN
jgi:hypothetical protein